jgi:hypothetical protein
MRLCKPHWTTGARALANSPSTNRACHFDRSGPTLFPTFAPAKVSPTKWRNLSSTHHVYSQFPQRDRYSSVTKMAPIHAPNNLQLAHFHYLLNSCDIRAFHENWPSCFQQLTDSFCALLSTFRTSNLLFSTICGLFWTKHRGVGGIET